LSLTNLAPIGIRRMLASQTHANPFMNVVMPKIVYKIIFLCCAALLFLNAYNWLGYSALIFWGIPFYQVLFFCSRLTSVGCAVAIFCPRPLMFIFWLVSSYLFMALAVNALTTINCLYQLFVEHFWMGPDPLTTIINFAMSTLSYPVIAWAMLFMAVRCAKDNPNNTSGVKRA